MDFKPTELICRLAPQLRKGAELHGTFFVFPVCLNGNSQGVASLSGLELAETFDRG